MYSTQLLSTLHFQISLLFYFPFILIFFYFSFFVYCLLFVCSHLLYNRFNCFPLVRRNFSSEVDSWEHSTYQDNMNSECFKSFFMLRWGETMSLWNWTANRPIVHPRNGPWVCEYKQRNYFARGKPNESEKNLSHYTLHTTNPTWITLVANPGLRVESRRLTAWAMTRPFFECYSTGHKNVYYSCPEKQVSTFAWGRFNFLLLITIESLNEICHYHDNRCCTMLRNGWMWVVLAVCVDVHKRQVSDQLSETTQH
jgi:hypothetical protein